MPDVAHAVAWLLHITNPQMLDSTCNITYGIYHQIQGYVIQRFLLYNDVSDR